MVNFLKKALRKDNEPKNKIIDSDNLAKQYQTNAHKLSLEELITTYNTDLKTGLSAENYQAALEKYGENELSPAKTLPWPIKMLISIFGGFFNILLWIGAILCIFAYTFQKDSTQENLWLGIVLAIVVIITGLFTFYQESRSSKIMASFKNFLPQEVNIFRDGVYKSVPAKTLVPGDLIIIKAGEKLPSDIRIINCSSDAQVNNASLTGEAEPQTRTVDKTHEEPMETKNLAFFGTLLVRGNCNGIVMNTGDNTLMGRIAKLAATTETEQTPIKKEIKLFIFKISAIAITLGIVFGIVRGIDTKAAIPTIIFVIGIIVANVPEGLLATLTVSLSLAAKRMAGKAVLVKNLEGVETLGSTSVICSDKTGTLTMNRMTVVNIYYDLSPFKCDASDPLIGEFDSNNQSFKGFCRCAALCNNAKFTEAGNITGDASESALVKFVNPHIKSSLADYRNENPIVHAIPFNSANKWQISIHQCKEGTESFNLVVLKGAPEKVICYCDRYIFEGEVKKLNEEIKERIASGILEFGKQGKRVLGFCELKLDVEKYPINYEFSGKSREEANFPFGRVNEEGLIFIGLSAMFDPPRPGVPAAVENCQTAGIRVIMVTGDHPITAKAIAKNVGIIKGETKEDIAERKGIAVSEVNELEAESIVVSGKEIADTVDSEDINSIIIFWNKILLKKNVVFARTSPQQKLLIVQACQERGEIVAVTGDGVNDSPALKKADIGVAMGITGTDVAKDAADMILLDDNFASIVNGVEEGRILFDNLKKSIAYTLSSNIPEIAPFLISTISKIPNPLPTVLILGIDLGTDLMPAISFAYETKESDIMERKPRNPSTDQLVTWNLIGFSYLQIGMIQAFAGFFAYFVVLLDNGIWLSYLIGLDTGSAFATCDKAHEYSKYMSCFNRLVGDHFCKYTPTKILTPPENTIFTLQNIVCEDRKTWLGQANAAYFVAIVIVQWADLLICKTRLNSIFRQGMSNKLMNISLLFETALAVLLVYVPPLHVVFGTRSLSFLYWLPALPFCLLIFNYDELRKLWIRKNNNGWIHRNTYW